MPFLFRTITASTLLIALHVGCADGADGADGAGEGEGEGEGETCPTVEGGFADGDGDCSATVSTIAAGGALGQARDHHQTWVAHVDGAAFVYVLGGIVNMSAAAYPIERAPVLADGSIGPFAAITQATGLTFTAGAGTASIGDTVVLTGGLRADAGGNLDTSPGVTVARAAGDGTLTFSAGPALPFPTFHGQAVAAGGRVYVVGGMHLVDAQTDRVASASLVDGVLGAWREEASMPSIRSHHGLASDGRFLFVTGGLEGDPITNPAAHTDVWSAAVGDDGVLSPWATAGALPASLAVHASTVVGDALFLLGGVTGNDATANVLRALVAADGTVGEFTNVGALPAPRSHTHQAPVVGNALVFVGGASLSAGHVSHNDAFVVTLR